MSNQVAAQSTNTNNQVNAPAPAPAPAKTRDEVIEKLSGFKFATVAMAAFAIASNEPTGETVGPFKRGQIVNSNLEFYQPPYPNPLILGVVQALSVRNSSQAGQTDFAALTRQDTEKTATEIQAAKEERMSLSGEQISILSSVVQDSYTLCWLIARSQVLLGQATLGNNIDPALLMLEYTLSPGGDVEVIERAEKEEKLKAGWEILSQTPAAPRFLKYLIETLFPDEAPGILAEIDRAVGDQNQMLAALVDVVSNLPLEALQSLSDEQRAKLQQLITAAKGVVAAPANQGNAPAAQQQSGPVADASYEGQPLG